MHAVSGPNLIEYRVYNIIVTLALKVKLFSIG
jgi:hypothetical protein